MLKIAQPLKIAGQTLPNRLVKAAMSERLAGPDGAPTEAHLRLYERWAAGGAGALITGNVMVDGAHLGEHGNVVIQDETNLDALRAWARAMKSGGASAWVQINHPGRQTPRFADPAPVAPSAVAMDMLPAAFARPRELSDAEIREVVGRFATTAAVVQRAGFDGVQVHGAHGYLVSQFLSPRTNLREDDWGGDDARRRRFLLEIVREIRRATGPDFLISVKLNSADFQRGGFTEEASMAVVEALEAEGADHLEISGGTYESAVMFGETAPESGSRSASTAAREAFFLDYAEKVRARTRLPLMVTGGFRTLAGMEAALESGATDLIGLGRPLAVEPDLPARLLSGEAVAARPVTLATGWKSVDSMVQGGWYQAQIHRMGRGEAPNPDLSRLRAAWTYLAGGPSGRGPRSHRPRA
jgi:2,4-dienoyl-CoA reductase-like NADH-dependent reductase (Old Yellow Enzyme family)